MHLIRRTSRRSALRATLVLRRRHEPRGPWLRRHELRDPAEVLSLDLGRRPDRRRAAVRRLHARQARSVLRAARASAGARACAPRGRTRRGRSATSAAIASPQRSSRSRTASASAACPPRAARRSSPRSRPARSCSSTSAAERATRRSCRRPTCSCAAGSTCAASTTWRSSDVDDATVTLRTPRGPLRVVVARREAEPRPISCGDEPEPVPVLRAARSRGPRSRGLMRAVLLRQPGEPLRAGRGARARARRRAAAAARARLRRLPDRPAPARRRARARPPAAHPRPPDRRRRRGRPPRRRAVAGVDVRRVRVLPRAAARTCAGARGSPAATSTAATPSTRSPTSATASRCRTR